MPQPEIPFSERVFNVAEAAEFLRISRPYFYKRVAAGDLHIIKLGTRTLVRGSELARFLDAAAETTAA